MSKPERQRLETITTTVETVDRFLTVLEDATDACVAGHEGGCSKGIETNQAMLRYMQRSVLAPDSAFVAATDYYKTSEHQATESSESATRRDALAKRMERAIARYRALQKLTSSIFLQSK